MLRCVFFGCSSFLTPWLYAILGAILSLSYPPKTVQFLPSSSESLCQQIEQQGAILEQQHKEGLIVKLGSYCAKRQWDVPAVISSIPTLADAISARPDGLADPKLTLKKMIDLHSAWNQQAASTLRRELLKNPLADVPPAVMAQSADGAYRLVECVTQKHLQEESAALGHCVGGTHLDYYRDKLARGASRIFSLRTAQGVPVATIEYNTKTKAIVQIEGKPRVISGEEKFFPSLCQTIHALAARLPVGSISGLPHPDGKILTKDGAFESVQTIADIKIADILIGIVKIDNTTPEPLLLQLSASPRLTLDVTDFDLSRLPVRVKCDLVSSATSFSAPQLQTSGYIDARSATSFSAPQLQTSGYIYARSATSFSAPQLQTSGDIYASSATSLSAPQLQTSGYIYASSATSFSAPQLQTSGDIDTRSATSFSCKIRRVMASALRY